MNPPIFRSRATALPRVRFAMSPRRSHRISVLPDEAVRHARYLYLPDEKQQLVREFMDAICDAHEAVASPSLQASSPPNPDAPLGWREKLRLKLVPLGPVASPVIP
jgi:hypothetical protein